MPEYLTPPTPQPHPSRPCRNLPPPQPSGTRGQHLTENSQDAKTLLQQRPEASQISGKRVTPTPVRHFNLDQLMTSVQGDIPAQAPTIALSAATQSPSPRRRLCEGVCIPLFNPDCHKIRQAESARNPFLLHLSKNQGGNSCLLQVCQTDAFPKEEHSRNSCTCSGKSQARTHACFVVSLGQG